MTGGGHKGLLIFDAGSGVRELGEYLVNDRTAPARKFEFDKGRGHAHLFLTHTHQDHIQGFPFFKPLHVPGNVINIYHVHDYVPEVLARQMTLEVFPLPFDQISATVRFHQLTGETPVTIGEAVITHMELQHPGKSYAYRVEADNAVAVIATDGEYEQLDYASTQKYRQFYQNADALIFDTMFSEREIFVKESWDRSHSATLVGVDIAREARVKRLFLFHSQPFMDRSKNISQVLQQTKEYLQNGLPDDSEAPEIIVAREGMEVNLANVTPVSRLHIEDWLESNVIFMSLTGKFGAYEVKQFNERLDHNLRMYHTDKVILRLEQLSELSMVGIRALVEARKSVMRLALVGVTGPIYHILELARVPNFFAVYPDVDTALQVLNASGQK